MKVGYVVKRYPRYSETFIVNEILAHEAAGIEPRDLLLAAAGGRALPGCDLPGTGTGVLPAVKRAESYGLLVSARGDRQDLSGGMEFPRGSAGRRRPLHLPGPGTRPKVRLRGISHLHAHFATASATVARLAARFAGVPYTLTAHAKDIFHESVRPDDVRRKLADAAAVVTVSDYNLEYLRENYGPAAQRVRPNLQRSGPRTVPLRSRRAERSPRIVGGRTARREKGVRRLIEACAILADEGSRVHLPDRRHRTHKSAS